MLTKKAWILGRNNQLLVIYCIIIYFYLIFDYNYGKNFLSQRSYGIFNSKSGLGQVYFWSFHVGISVQWAKMGPRGGHQGDPGHDFNLDPQKSDTSTAHTNIHAHMHLYFCVPQTTMVKCASFFPANPLFSAAKYVLPWEGKAPTFCKDPSLSPATPPSPRLLAILGNSLGGGSDGRQAENHNSGWVKL